MALSVTHQMASLVQTPIRSGSRNSSAGSTATVSAAAVRKLPTVNLRCKVKKSGGVDGLSPALSPCQSLVPGRIRPELSVACQAFATDLEVPATAETETWTERRYRSVNGLGKEKGMPAYVMMPFDSMTMGNTVNRRKAINGRPEFSVAGQAFSTAESETSMERKYISGNDQGNEKGVPVYVMMPLDSVTMGNTVNRRKAMNASLQALKSAGVDGIMMDVWWGLVERNSPGEYNWGGYAELLEMAKKHGLKVQAVMSFHQCGGNVGDTCNIPLPNWVVEEIDNDHDLAYTDQWGKRNYEYVSLGCDTLPVLKGRTPVQCYSDFMRAFRNNFQDLLGDTIVEIQVGMGPAGELRYPSYPEQNGTWRFPGIGAFQCFDKYMLSSLKAAAEAAGKPEWGSTGPTDAGHYNNWPEDTSFFRRDGGGWNGPYGDFFLTWYSQMLLDHGERIVGSAKSIFNNAGVKISVKIAGIHWHYGTRSHAPELTAGYYNTRHRDGYYPIAQMLARHGAVFNFTCLEMRDNEQPQDALCAPEKLVKQVVMATERAQVPLAGENALPRYDQYAHEQLIRASQLNGDGNSGDSKMCAFTYLRMNPHLFQSDNWRKFVGFVKKMKEGKCDYKCWEQVEREAEHSVQETQPLVSEAAVELMH